MGKTASEGGAGGSGTTAGPEIVPDEVTPVEQMELIGGDVSLDFVNTGSHRATPPFKEKLRAYPDLVSWAVRVDEVSAGTGDRLRAFAQRDAAGAEAVLVRARQLREAIYRAFTSLQSGASPTSADLATIAAENARATVHRRLVPTEDGCVWQYGDEDALERPLWSVALAASTLLTSPDVSRVKECASDNCNWLFLDVSKNRSRRWCDMKDCGNRAKARRHRARTSS